ncbi:MAG: type II secretion system protein [Verrucomicrobiota bacterium]
MRAIRKHQRGFVLLEVVLAIGLFAIVATAMVVALDRLANASTSARKEAILLRKLETLMTEAAHSGLQLQNGTTEFPADQSGVEAVVEIAEETNLGDLFRITVRARFAESPDEERQLEQVVYAP